MNKNKALPPVKDAPIKLQHPYTTDAGVPIEQVHVKPITVRQMKMAQRRAGSDEAEAETAMVAMACDLVPEDLDAMMMADYTAVRARFSKLNFGSSADAVAEPTGTAG